MTTGKTVQKKHAEHDDQVEEPGGVESEPITIYDFVEAELRKLPYDRQKLVLEFTRFLIQQEEIVRAVFPPRSVRGLWADLNIDLSEEEITQARREAWGGAPRPDDG